MTNLPASRRPNRRSAAASKRRLRLETLEKRLLLVSEWTNSFNARDVNADTEVTALDALVGINELGRRPSGDDGTLGVRDPQTDLLLYDVNGDGKISAIDSLIIVNALSTFVPPTVEIELANDTAPFGQTNSDGVTSDATITGSFTDVGDSVRRLVGQIDDGDPFDVPVREGGTFEVDPRLPDDGSVDGQHIFRVTAYDDVTIVAAAEIAIDLDTVPPVTPTDLSLTDQTDSGDDQSDNLTNDSVVMVEGISESESFVSLIVDAQKRGTTTADGNHWQIDVDGLPEDSFSFSATAQDAAGNESVVSPPLAVVIDRKAPTALFAESADDGLHAVVYFDDKLGATAADASNYSITLDDGPDAGQDVPITSAQVVGAFVRLQVAAPLDLGQTYRVEVSSAVSDKAGNTIAETSTVEFRRQSSLLINNVSPRDGEDAVGLTREVVVRFTENIDPATVTSDSVRVTSLGELVSGRLAVSSTERFVTFFPDEPWSPSSQVRVEVDGSIIRGRSDELIDADADGHPGGLHVTEFRTLSLTRIEGTDLFGNIFDAYTQLPIEGATVRVDGLPELTAVTDQDGFFRLEDAPAPVFFVHVDGTTAVNTPSGVMYPNVGKPFHSVAGQAVHLNHHGHEFDIFLPQMADGDIQALSATDPTDVGFGAAGKQELSNMFPEIDAGEWDKVKVTFFANSAQANDGTPATQATIIPVPPERLPAPLPAGFDPKLVISIQALGANNFDVPAPITFPNIDNFALGSRPTIWSFDHDKGEFIPIGTGTVVDDGDGGTLIESNDGTGILAPGWHFFSPDLRWVGNEQDPGGGGSLEFIDPVETPVEAKILLLSNEYGSETPRDSYIFRFEPPPGPDGLSDEDHTLSLKAKVARGVNVTISNPKWFRVLYDLNPAFDRALGADGKIRFVLRPGDQNVTFSATLRLEKDVIETLRNLGPTGEQPLRNTMLFTSRITVEETTVVIDPESGTNSVASAVKDKVPLILLDLADDESDGRLQLRNIVNSPESLSHNPIYSLGSWADVGLGVSMESVEDGDVPPVFRLGSPRSRSFVVDAMPTGGVETEGNFQAKLKFQVSLNDAGGKPGRQTVNVIETFKPIVQVRVTPRRRIFLDREGFIAAINNFSNDPEIDYFTVGTEIESIFEQILGEGKVGEGGQIELVDGTCGLCDKPGEMQIRWNQNRSSENPTRYGIAQETRFDTERLATLLNPSEDRTKFIVDETIPPGRQQFILDTVFNSRNQFTGRADIHFAAHFGGILSSFRDEGATLKDIAVTVAHEFLHLAGLAHLDLANVPSRDLLHSKTQSPSQLSFLTRESARFALDSSSFPLAAGDAARIATLVQAYADALTQDSAGEYFPNAANVHQDLLQRRAPEIPQQPAVLLSTVDARPFSSEPISIGEVVVDGTGGETLSQTILLENDSAELMQVDSVTIVGGGDDLTISGLGTNQTLQPFESVELQLIVDATEIGEIADSILVVAHVPSQSEAIESEFRFSATGISQAPSVETFVDLQNNNFGGVSLGSTSPFFATMTITNRGAEELMLTPALAGGGTDFVFQDPDDFMTAIQRGESVSIAVAFRPTKLGLRPATIRIATNDPLHPLITQSVVGTGIPSDDIGPNDFDWGNDYLQITDGPLVNRLLTDSGGNFEIGVSTESEYSIQVFDPVSGLVARHTARSGVSGGFDDVSFPLTFEASIAADDDGDGLPNDIEEAIGTSLTEVDTDQDTINDFAEILRGLNPLDGLVFPTGVIGSISLPGESQELALRRTDEGKRLAYVATGDHGFAIVDISQLNNPIALGFLDLAGTSTDIAVDDQTNRAYIGNSSSNVQVVNLNDPMRPVLEGALPASGSRLELLGGIAYVANGNVLTTVDIATNQVIEDNVLGLDEITDIAVEASFVYTMDTQRLLRIHEIDGLRLTARGSITLPQGAGRITVADSIVFAAASNSFFRGGFVTVDVSNPDDPQLVSGSDVQAPNVDVGTAVASSGSGLGAIIGTPDATSNHAIKIVDLTDLSETDVSVSRFSLPSSPNAISISSGAAFVADDRGLQVVNFLPFDNLGVAPVVSVSIPLADLDQDQEGFQVLEGATVPVQVDVFDDLQVSEVQLLVNNQVIQTDIDFPWVLSTTATSVESGEFVVQVRAVDTGGNESTSSVIVLQPIEDSVAPTIESLSPSNGATGAPGRQVVHLRFSEPISSETINAASIRLRSASGNEIEFESYRFRSDDTQLQVTYPSLGLGSYILTIDAPTITDRAGNPLGADAVVNEFTIEVADLLGLYPNSVLSTPDEPHGVAIGDLNGDGKLDLLSANYIDSSISVYLADTNGGFSARQDYATTLRTRVVEDVYLQDINNDGFPDVVVRTSTNSVVTLINQGNGNFDTPIVHPIQSSGVKTLEFADLNGDTHLDILVFRGSVSTLLIGAGDGTFTRQDISLAGSLAGAALGDFNEDQNLDVIGEGSRRYDFFAGNGDGTFEPAVTTNTTFPIEPTHVVAGHFNDDSHLDFAASDARTFEQETISLYFGAGDGTFSDPQSLPVPALVDRLYTRDLNDDGINDLIAASNLSGSDGSVTVLISDGQGGFTERTVQSAESNAGLAVGDLNGDGLIDLVTPDRNNHKLQIQLGTGPGVFSSGISVSLGTGSTATAIPADNFFDTNADGIDDLVRVEPGVSEYAVTFRRGIGDGTFGGVQAFEVPRANGFEIGDLNQDGVTDVVTVSQGSDNVSVLVSGDPGIYTSTNYPAGDAPGALAIGDVDGDGFPDLMTYSFGEMFHLLTNRGDGTYLAANTVLSRPDVFSMELADVNSDDRADLIWYEPAATSDGRIAVSIANDTGGFDAPLLNVIPRSASTALGIQARDIDNDGSVDLLIDFVGYGASQLLYGRGDGTFETPVAILQPENPSFVKAVDLDLDGNLDIVTGEAELIGIQFGNGDRTFDPILHFRTGKLESAGLFTAPYLLAGDVDGDGDVDIAVAWGDSMQVLLKGGRTGFANGLSFDPDAATKPEFEPEIVSAAQVSPLYRAALHGWADAGLAQEDLDHLARLNVMVTDLPGNRIGLGGSDVIWIDSSAAGAGWYIDSDPTTDDEFHTELEQPFIPNGVDLLTTLMHEMGHVLGLQHDSEVIGTLMDDLLGEGKRRRPTADLVDEVLRIH